MTVQTTPQGKFKLAELLLRRKELENRVASLKHIQTIATFEVKAKRVKVTDDIDELVAQVPKLTAAQLLHELDWHARQLRLTDAAIQQANWTVEVEVAASVMTEYTPPEGWGKPAAK